MQIAWSELRRVVKKTKRNPSDKTFTTHAVAAKRTLYAAQALSDILGGPKEEFSRRVDVMQKYLGERHDLVIASGWFRDVGREHPNLKKVAKKLAIQERRRADKRAERWTGLLAGREGTCTPTSAGMTRAYP